MRRSNPVNKLLPIFFLFWEKEVLKRNRKKMKRKRRKRRIQELSRRRSNPVTRLSPSFPAAYCLPCRLSTLFHSYKANTNSYQTEDKKIIGKYKSYLKSQLEVRADGANTSVLFLGFCAIFFLQWTRKYCFFALTCENWLKYGWIDTL